MLTVVTDDDSTPAGRTSTVEEPSAVGGSWIDEIVREGARRMLAAALEAEVAAYIAAHAGGRRRFTSAILPPWCRKSSKVTEVLPLLYLHGLSSSDFIPALESFLGTGSGPSAEIWNAEDRDHARRAVAAFKLAYGAKFGKAVAKITDDLDELLAPASNAAR